MSGTFCLPCPPSIQACKTRTILTLQQAIDIFAIKMGQLGSNTKRSKYLTAAVVARSFGVSEKAIRDIWSGRTWVRETMHLDPAGAAAKTQRLRLPGRPKCRRGNETKQRTEPNMNHLTASNPESEANLADYDISEGVQSRPRFLRSPASMHSDDPFHYDWPHWDAAYGWEQRATADGFFTSAIVCCFKL
jgi:hypothetical protein